MAKCNVSWKKRIAIFAIGIMSNEVYDLIFDNILYPYVIGFYGMILGGMSMFIISIITCYLFLKFYDWSKKDWLGVESLKEAKEFENSWLNRLIAKFMNNSEWAQLIVISIAKDPFIATVFLRKGAHEYNVMTKKDWRNFWTSIVISNTFWIVICWISITTFKAFGMKLEYAITISSCIFITIALVGFIVGHFYSRKEKMGAQL